MPIYWDDSDDVPEVRNKWQIIRVPRGGKIVCLALSHHVLGVWTHYYGGRTQPCRRDDCKMCVEQGTRRRHLYLGIWNPETGHKNLLELTAAAGFQLLGMKKNDQSVRGRKLTLTRVNKRINSPIQVEIGEDYSGKYQLPTEPAIAESLRIIWHLTTDATFYDQLPEGTPVRPHIRRKKATDGANSKEPDQAHGLQQPGRLGGTNGVHLEAQGNGRFSPRSSSEPTFD